MDSPRLLDVRQSQPLRQGPDLLHLLLVGLRIIIAPLFIKRLDYIHITGWFRLFLNLLILPYLIIALIDVKIMRLVALRLKALRGGLLVSIGCIEA